jgi:glycosyltransferase involved in cell wall biosynthesis
MISILVPAYNEEKRISGTLEKMSRFFEANKIDYEVVVAVDGSKDSTKSIVERMAANNERIRMTYNEGRSGKGGALLRAFQHSKGDKIVFADADNAAVPEELAKLANELDKYDVAWSRRVSKDADKQPLSRTILGKIYGYLVMIVFLSKFYDIQSGYKAFRREVLENVFPKVKSLGIEYDLELLVRIKKAGYSISQTEIYWKHVEGSPSFRFTSHIFTYSREMLKIRLRTLF